MYSVLTILMDNHILYSNHQHECNDQTCLNLSHHLVMACLAPYTLIVRFCKQKSKTYIFIATVNITKYYSLKPTQALYDEGFLHERRVTTGIFFIFKWVNFPVDTSLQWAEISF